MKIINEYPPMWTEINEKFDLTGKKPIFAYGDCVYNPFEDTLPLDLVAHEEVHLKQQNNNRDVAKLWWDRYLGDKEFMLSQELEAYNTQYKFMCKQTKDRNKQFKYLYMCAEQLSSKMYGNPITLQDALLKIKNFKNI